MRLRAAFPLLATLAWGCAGDAPRPASAASFRLAFWHEKEDGEAVALGDTTVLRSGSRLGMVLECNGSCDVFVVYRDASDAVHVLFPGRSAGARVPGSHQLIPAGQPLDFQTGLETFHVIASREPLPDLAAAVRARIEAPEAERPAASAALLDAIQEVRRRHEAPERPVPTPVLIAGRTRSAAPGSEYSFDGAFCRTFVIDHR